MKKIICYVVIIIILVNSIVGCNNNEKEDKEEGVKFDIKKAEGLVDNYMKDMVIGDQEAMNKLLTDKLLKERKVIAKTALKVVGYKVDEINQVGNTGVFKVKVSSSSMTKCESSLDTYTFKVGLEDLSYKVSEIKSVNEKESFYENYGIRIRNKSNVRSDLLLDSDGIPQYSFSKDDKTQESKILLPRSNFNKISFDYVGNSLAISTVDGLAFLGIVKISTDSIETLGEQPGGGSQDSGSQNSKDQSQKQGPREKPIGKELLALDVLKDCRFDFMVFSPDEKFLLVQYNNSENRKCLRIYKTDKGDLIPFKFEENYNVNNLDIKYTYFDNEYLYYEIVPKADKADIEKQAKGKWQLDLKEFRVKKL